MSGSMWYFHDMDGSHSSVRTNEPTSSLYGTLDIMHISF